MDLRQVQTGSIVKTVQIIQAVGGGGGAEDDRLPFLPQDLRKIMLLILNKKN
jgi:hypothetical protein